MAPQCPILLVGLILTACGLLTIEPTPTVTSDAVATGTQAHAVASATPLPPTAMAELTGQATPIAAATTETPVVTGLPSPTDTRTPAPTASAAASPSTTATRIPSPIPRPSATPAQPAVQFFTIAPPTIRAGDPVTLTWSATAEQVVIYRLDALGRLTMPAYEVPLSGTLVVTTPETLHNSVNFVLFAISPVGTAQAGAYATILCLDTWFFAKPPSDCPVGPPKWTQLIVQDFEHGQMLWAEVSRMIYILYTGGTRWEIRPDTWVEGMSEDDPAIMPPAGFFQPVRGFGLVWRDEQTPAGARVRDRLGWARNEEYPMGQGAVQCNSAPKYITCYVSGPGGIVYELKPEGSGWSVWAGS